MMSSEWMEYLVRTCWMFDGEEWSLLEDKGIFFSFDLFTWLNGVDMLVVLRILSYYFINSLFL